MLFVRILLVFIIFFSETYFALSQRPDITISKTSVSEGLSQSTVTALYTDSRGFVWAGTCNGINRLDGNMVSTTSEKTENSYLASNITVRSIQEICGSHYLIGTEAGVMLIDKSLKKSYHYTLASSTINDKMLKLFRLGKYFFFVSRENFIIKYDSETRSTEIIKNRNGEGSRSFIINENTAIWVSRNPCRINYFDASTGKHTYTDLPAEMQKELLFTIHTGPDEKIIVSTGSGFAIIKNKKDILGYYPVSSLNVDGITAKSECVFAAYSPDNKLWVGVRESGIYCFDTNVKVIHSYNSAYLDKSGNVFNLKLPVCCSFDRSGNIFIGTDGNGIIKINPGIRKFNYINPSDIRALELNDNFVRSLYKDNSGIYYFGTLNAGLHIYDKVNDYAVTINTIKNSQEKFKQVYFIFPYTNNILLIGTGSGIMKYETGKNYVSYVSENNSKVFTSACRIQDNKIILGSGEGLFQLSGERIVKIESGYINQISFVSSIDSQNVAVAERGDKVYIMNYVNNNISFIPAEIPDSIFEQVGKEKPSFNGFVRSGKFYYAASSFGLVCFDLNLKFIKLHRQTENGIALYIYSIQKDKNENLWLGTSKGLVCYYVKNDRFHSFSTDDGLQSNEFNTNASFVTPGGEMIFGGINGINSFYPDSIRLNKNTPSIFLKELQVNNESVNIDSLQKQNNIKFEYDQNRFLFSFFVNEYTLPNKNELKVYLKGLDKTWINVKDRNQIMYSFLPPGDYELWVTASNYDKQWSSPNCIFKFRINKPFWDSLWFILLMIFFSVAFLSAIYYFIYLHNIRKEIREIRHLQEIEKVRLRISREIHDDIGSGMTQVAMIAESLKTSEAFYEKQNPETKKLDRLIQLTRELIQSMGEIVWVTNPLNDELENMMVYIRQTINRMTEDSGFDLNISFPEVFPKINVASDLRRKFILIIKESVNNALKHSGGNAVSVVLKIEQEEMFSLIISNNGNGFGKKENPAGNGLRNISQHAKDISLELFFKNNESGGASVELRGNLRSFATKV